MSSAGQSKSGIIICVLFCVLTVASGFRIMSQGDTLPPRQPRGRPMAVVGATEMVDQNGYPAHDDFLKQLINYLELVGRK